MLKRRGGKTGFLFFLEEEEEEEVGVGRREEGGVSVHI